jgi:hypothetical protein
MSGRAWPPIASARCSCPPAARASRRARWPAASTAGWPGAGGEHQLGEIELFGVVVPEPSTLAIWSLLALLGIGVGWRRRK